MFVSTLSDGTAVRLRFIRPEDKPLLEDGLRRLSLETVVKRFLVPKARFTPAELRYLTEVDGEEHVAIVGVLAHDPDRFVAVGRFIRHPERREEAEIAIVIADELQGLGLGRTIGGLLADEARVRGVRRFTATLLGTNVAAHRLFASISSRLRAHLHDGVEEIVAELYTAEHPTLAA